MKMAYYDFLQVAFAVIVPTLLLNDGNTIPVVALGTGRFTAKEVGAGRCL